MEHFSKCIALDKSNEIYYSNRAAALSALKRYTEALEDAKAVVRLKPKWAKGWARAGVAHFGLEEWAEVQSPCSILLYNALLSGCAHVL